MAIRLTKYTIPFKTAASFALSLVACVYSDSVKPLTYGPFFMNQVSSTISPVGYNYVMSNVDYHFQIGWIEPIANKGKGIFGETYFETSGNFTVSPFTSDIGTTFNLKPIRYLELGLSYNRLLFHNTLVTFDSPTNGQPLPPLKAARPSEIFSRYPKDPGGADVFTFQSNLTFNLGPTQFYFFASRTLWDIDAKGKEFVYEYTTDMLIRTRDRVNTLLGQFTYDLRPHSYYESVSFTGLTVSNQYWHTTQTRLKKNLVSGGISGFRFGRNTEHQRRGLDLSLGFWTMHPQVPKDDWAKSIVLIGDWKWNIQFLKI